MSDPRHKIMPTPKDGGAYEFYRDTGFLRTTGLRQKHQNLLLVPFNAINGQAFIINPCKEIPHGLAMFQGPRWRYNRLPRFLRVLHALESIQRSTGLPVLGQDPGEPR